MDLTEIGGIGISVASLLHLCSTNATPDLPGVATKRSLFQRRIEVDGVEEVKCMFVG